MIPAGTGIRTYKNVKLYDGNSKDLDEQMNEIIERRKLEKEQEEFSTAEPSFDSEETD